MTSEQKRQKVIAEAQENLDYLDRKILDGIQLSNDPDVFWRQYRSVISARILIKRAAASYLQHI